MKLTPWFQKNVKPVHVGVYEVDRTHANKISAWYAYWNGEKFMFRSSVSPYDAYNNSNFPSIIGDYTTWRGLAEKPK